MSFGTHIKADEIELVVPFISSSHNSSTPAASFQTHEQLNLSLIVDQIIIMAIIWQKMALLAVASLLHVGIIQLRAEASVVSGSQQQQLQIDKYP
jgi:hypothetical protein